MKPLLITTVTVFLAASFAGCLEDPKGFLEQPSNEAPAVGIDESLRIEAKDCIQAGGNSVYSIPGQWPAKVGPFHAADQRAEVGDP
ncbi:MAG TPA: hypothetical protein VGB18_08690, partial [Candidatus Thermoplasmatota archaeon]